jgi:6-pyruvoyltetrahydropterin/6-carboxytetrahydropterin synthase
MAMFTVTVETAFTAAHQLTFADGQKEPLHRHDWLVKVAVSTAELDQAGLAIDFNDLKAKIASITAPFDKATLEQLPVFKGKNASAENVAKHIFNGIEPLLSQQLKLRYVEVTEAPGCRAKYEERKFNL